MSDPQKMVAIRYIGAKARKGGDSVIPTSKIVWQGYGDVQMVPVADALLFLNPLYSMIWELVPVDASSEEEPPADGDQVPDLPDLPPASGAAEPAADQDESPPATAEEAQKRIEEILMAVPRLKKSDFNSDGSPKVISLSSVLKKKVSREEVHAAWELIKQQSGVSQETESSPE